MRFAAALARFALLAKLESVQAFERLFDIA